MLKLEYITEKGAVLPLTNNSKFKLSNVDGITLAEVDISSTTVSGMDGDFVTAKTTQPRSIVLDISIETADVESVKRYIMQYIKPKQTATLRMTQNERVTQIKGIVESIEMPRFSNAVTMQVSLYCSQPYWEDVDSTVTEITEVLDMHYFTDEPDDMLYFIDDGIVMGEYDANRTKTIVNDGDVSVGMDIHIIALGGVTNPVLYKSNGEYIGADVTMETNDEIIIKTGKGEKSITMNGENIMSKLRRGSTWLQLDTGDEDYTIDSEDGTESNMYFNIVYRRRYV
jgi:hypothetical protein